MLSGEFADVERCARERPKAFRGAQQPCLACAVTVNPFAVIKAGMSCCLPLRLPITQAE